MSELRLVLFDVDGTLMDSQDFIVEAMGRAFAAIDREAPARDEVLRVVGLASPDAITRIAPDLDAAAVAAGAAAYKAAFLALREEHGGEANAPLYPGTRAALEALHAQDEILLGVATGKARRGLDHAFRVHDLDRFFVTRQTADTNPSKPNPTMVHTALAETGVVAGHAAMVGDTTYDIEMARAAGVLPIGVSWGYHPAEALMEAGAAHVLRHFDELPAMLNGIWGRNG